MHGRSPNSEPMVGRDSSGDNGRVTHVGLLNGVLDWWETDLAFNIVSNVLVLQFCPRLPWDFVEGQTAGVIG
jgi:hypothetical protein